MKSGRSFATTDVLTRMLSAGRNMRGCGARPRRQRHHLCSSRMSTLWGSITVTRSPAPLTDLTDQNSRMRSASIAVLREIGVEQAGPTSIRDHPKDGG